MSNQLAGKIALVTGGTTGIGLATAKRFAREGAIVYITGRRRPELEKAVSEIGAAAIGVSGDISKLADVEQLAARIKSEQGRLDILFANAGGGSFARLGEITEAQIDRELSINIKGTLLSVQAVLPLMPDGSSIVLNASSAAGSGTENFSVYSATKAAVRSFARTWTSDLKSRGIRVNAVSPGPVVTPAYDDLLGKDNVSGFVEYMSGLIPLGRVGREDEIAAAVTFLASDESSYITGIDLNVDGGMTQV